MSEYEIYSYEAFRKRIRDDIRTISNSKMQLLDEKRMKDYLDAVKAKIDHVELDHFYYTQMMYSMEENKTIYKKKLVSDEVTEVIKKALERPYDAAIDLDAESGYMDYSQFRDLRCTDKDLLFTNDINMEVCKMSSGEYYVYGVSSKTGSQMPYWKKVAPEDNALLDELFYPDVVETIFPEKVE